MKRWAVPTFSLSLFGDHRALALAVSLKLVKDAITGDHMYTSRIARRVEVATEFRSPFEVYF